MKPQLFNIAFCLCLAMVITPDIATAHIDKSITNPCDLHLGEVSEKACQQHMSEVTEVINALKHETTSQTNGNNADNYETEASYTNEKRKSFDMNYKVNNADALNIENKFGRVHVNTWDKNEIKVRVDVIARASSDGKAQEILDNINITGRRSDNTIFVATKMEPIRVSGSANKSFEINYTVYMPAENMLTVKNTFGDVYLASLKGKTDISVKYGSLKTDKLSNSDNKVTLAYSSGSCSYINGGNIEVSYSNMNVNATNGLQGFSKFSDLKIGDLRDELTLEVKYGSFKVDNVSKNIRKISLDSGFTPILLNFEDKSAFNFDVNVSFADFKVDKSLVNITHLERKTSNAKYEGKYGNTASKALVSINSKYGDVRFTK